MTGSVEEHVLAAELLASERGSEKERNKSWLKGIFYIADPRKATGSTWGWKKRLPDSPSGHDHKFTA